MDSIDRHFRRVIDEIIMECAATMEVSEEELTISFNEYSNDKGEVPYINEIVEKSTLTKEEFERFFAKKYRERSRTLEVYWKTAIDDKLLPLKDELVNFEAELRHVFTKPSFKKHKAIAVRLEIALEFMEGDKATEFRTFKCNPGPLLLCSSSTTQSKGFAFMLVDVVRCKGEPGAYEWIFDNFRPIVPFAVKNGQKFFNVEADLKWLNEVYPNGLPDGFWENIVSKGI